MTDGQWEDLLRIIGGDVFDPLPVVFLVDGPWIAGINGIGLFPSIDGILLLEDLMGFVGKQDFEHLVLPRMQRIFASLGVSVRFLHNDAFGLITARYLTAMGVNLFNFSFEHDPREIRRLAGDTVTLMGDIPPRDVRRSVAGMLSALTDRRRWIISAGGFTPGGFNAEKIEAFWQTVAAA